MSDKTLIIFLISFFKRNIIWFALKELASRDNVKNLLHVTDIGKQGIQYLKAQNYNLVKKRPFDIKTAPEYNKKKIIIILPQKPLFNKK